MEVCASTRGREASRSPLGSPCPFLCLGAARLARPGGEPGPRSASSPYPIFPPYPVSLPSHPAAPEGPPTWWRGDDGSPSALGPWQSLPPTRVGPLWALAERGAGYLWNSGLLGGSAPDLPLDASLRPPVLSGFVLLKSHDRLPRCSNHTPRSRRWLPRAPPWPPPARYYVPTTLFPEAHPELS